MIACNPQAQALVGPLLEALHRQEQLLEIKTSQMARLFDVIAERDDAAMEKLLEEMELTESQQSRTDAALAAAKNNLALALGLPPSAAVGLSMLAGRLDEESAQLVRGRQRRLRLLVEALRRKHLATSHLLHECATINRAMLEAMSGRQATMTYRPDGKVQWQLTDGYMNKEL